MIGDESLIPFDWYNSGRLWYCSLQRSDGTKVWGAGKTKAQAVDDARKDLKRIDRKRSKEMRVYYDQKELGTLVANLLFEKLYAQKARQE